MSIISLTYFQQGELKLPIDNINDIQFFIDKHEKTILKLLLGYSLYNEFITALAGSPAAKWTQLRDGTTYTDDNGDTQEYEGIFYIIADYVYFMIINDKQTYPTDSGVKSSLTDNASNATPRNKQVYAWNDMVDRIFYLDEFIRQSNETDSSTYENYDPITDTDENYFDKVNHFNI